MRCCRSMLLLLPAWLLSPALATAQAPTLQLQPPAFGALDADNPADRFQPESIVPHSADGCECPACRAAGASPHGPLFGQPHHDLQGSALISESWQRRPWHVDGFMGALWGNEAIDGRVAQQMSAFGGFRIGRDIDEHWGWETRFGFSSPEINNFTGDTQDRTGELFLWDLNLVHYLPGDRWIRPYVSIGVGLADWTLVDDRGELIEETVPGVPISLGVKHRYDDWLVFRLDLTDNIALGGGSLLGTQHNFSITGGMEFRFGGRRTSYWPWRQHHFYW